MLSVVGIDAYEVGGGEVDSCRVYCWENMDLSSVGNE